MFKINVLYILQAYADAIKETSFAYSHFLNELHFKNDSAAFLLLLEEFNREMKQYLADYLRDLEHQTLETLGSWEPLITKKSGELIHARIVKHYEQEEFCQ